MIVYRKSIRQQSAPVKIEDHRLDGSRYAVKTTEYIWSSWLKPVVG